jgi:pimeloyl-ACP methyl ester carboxylesterase
MKTYPGDPGRVATVLPGKGYSPAAPLLHYATMLLRDRGWTVRQLWWDKTEMSTEEAAVARARRELDAVTAPVHLVVAKSLGTLALPIAAEMGLPGVWLTPILTDPGVAAALSRIEVPALLIGGTADPFWVSDVARGERLQVLEIAGADHGLEFGGAVLPAIAALRKVTEAMASFVDDIPGAP